MSGMWLPGVKGGHPANDFGEPIRQVSREIRADTRRAWLKTETGEQRKSILAASIVHRADHLALQSIKCHS
jgi:hypothetical protein